MMLVQKQPNLPTMHFNNTLHRRHPSAPPAVVVQPTRTPGLLSLSKPTQQHRPRASPRVKAAQPAAASSAAPATSTPAPATSRGRGSKPKERPANNASRSASRGRRGHHSRQPSPPIPPSSQAEPPSINPKSINRTNNNNNNPTVNIFDPFMDDFTPSKPLPVRSAPTLAERPTGTLATRRRQPALAAVAPTSFPSTSPNGSNSKPIPVPKSKQQQHIPTSPTLARSHPRGSRFSTPTKKAGARVFEVSDSDNDDDGFPICDDMTDAGDLASERSDLVVSSSWKPTTKSSSTSKLSTKPTGMFTSDSDLTPPTTPTKASRAPHRQSSYIQPAPPRARIDTSASFGQFDDGPKTAPISGASASVAFPFSTTTAPPTSTGGTPKKDKRGGRNNQQGHRRAPSVGPMHRPQAQHARSDDERGGSGRGPRKFTKSMSMNTARHSLPLAPRPSDSSASSSGGLGAALSALFAGASGSLPAHGPMTMAGFFASSQFQNSPSPEELPPPPF